MTNTLHRFGSAESFVDDIIVFAVASKGTGQGDTRPALRRFVEIAEEFGAVNIGATMFGGALRPTRSRNPFAHWFKRNKPDYKSVRDRLSKATTTAAVFDNLETAQRFAKRIRDENFGVSVNISTSLQNAKACCQHAGVKRHSLGYSLGFSGMGENMPNTHAIMLSTMCGHGLIAEPLAKKMIAFVKENRRTPEEAAASLQRFCSCGIFNPTRACRILEDARLGIKD
jgi:hypothetical protein